MSKSVWVVLAGLVAVGCSGASDDGNGPADGGAADGGAADASSPPAELANPAAALEHFSRVSLFFGTHYPEQSCMDGVPAMTISLIDSGPGTYLADESARTCIADAGVGYPCGNEVVARMGSATGKGTLRLTKTTSSSGGTFEGDVNLVFDLGAEKPAYAFSFVAPVCAIE